MTIFDPLKSLFQSMFGRWEDKPSDQNYYVKIFFAFISAIVCGLAGQAFAGIRGIMFGLLIYVVSLYVLVYLVEIDMEALGGRQKLITSALFSYLMLWVLLWTLLYGFSIPQTIIDNLLFINPQLITT